MTCVAEAQTSHILATARQLELEVSGLATRAEDLRNEQERWREHNKNGMPRREIAAMDHVHDKIRESNDQEKKARDSEHRASIQKRALENTSRACAERVKRAEDLAKRAEEKLATAENTFSEWRVQADKEKLGSQARRERAHKGVGSHVAVAGEEAEQRKQEADADVARETARVDLAIEQMRQKLAKQREVIEKRGKDRHARAEARLRAAEAEGQAAEAKKDRDVEMAAVRVERSRTAGQSKVRIASLAKEQIATRTLLRLDQAKNERVLRLEAAKLREIHAIEAREMRVRATEARIERLGKDRLQVFADCAEVEKEYELMVERLRRELTVKAETWDAMACDAEEVSKKKVADVQALAARIKDAFSKEVEASKAQVEAQAVSVQEHLVDHQEVVRHLLDKRRQHTAQVLRLADTRVDQAEVCAKQQLAEVQNRTSAVVDLVKEELEVTKGLASSRIQKAVDHLMTYIEEGASPASPQGTSIELWMPLPGMAD